MKIVQVIPNLTAGGAERFVVDLCNELTRDSEVILILLYARESKEFYYELLDKSIKVINLGKRPGLDFSVFTKLYSTIKIEKPTVVHSHLRALNYLLPSVLILRKIGFVHTVHTTADMEASRVVRFIRALFYRAKYITPVTIAEDSDESFRIHYPGVHKVMIRNGRSHPE